MLHLQSVTFGKLVKIWLTLNSFSSVKLLLKYQLKLFEERWQPSRHDIWDDFGGRSHMTSSNFRHFDTLSSSRRQIIIVIMTSSQMEPRTFSHFMSQYFDFWFAIGIIVVKTQYSDGNSYRYAIRQQFIQLQLLILLLDG